MTSGETPYFPASFWCPFGFCASFNICDLAFAWALFLASPYPAASFGGSWEVASL